MRSYQVVRVMPNGARQIFNTVGGRDAVYRSFHSELDGRSIMLARDRKKLALEIAEGWARRGPWPEARFVVEEVI